MKSRIDIDHISALAHLCLSDEEKVVLVPQLTKIVEWVGKLDKLRIDEPMEGPDSHLPFPLPLRCDEVRESQPLSVALSNAPDKEIPFIKVPKVIEEK